MPLPPLYQEGIVLFLLIALGAFFSMSETALISMSKLRILFLLEKDRRGAAKLLKLKQNPQRFLTTILICNNICNVTASVIATAIAFTILPDHALSYAAGLMTFLILFFGDIIPKSAASAYKEQIALAVAAPILFLTELLFPVVWLINKCTSVITRRAPKKPLITEEEIRTFLRLGQMEGEITKEEQLMIQRIFKFDDIQVSQIMTPKSDIVMLPASAKVKDLLRLLRTKSFSRVPLYNENESDPIGVVFTKHALKLKNQDTPLRAIMEPISFVAETENLDNLLSDFKRNRESIAMVIDKSGRVTGLVTLRDLFEEIVGRVVEEKEKIAPAIRKIAKKSWLVEGKTSLEEIAENLNIRLQDDKDYGTIGGYILDKIPKIPEVGDMIFEDHFRIVIQKIEGKRIKEVKIVKA